MSRFGVRVRWLIGGSVIAGGAVAMPLLQQHMRATTTGAALEVQLARGAAYADSLLDALEQGPADAITRSDAAAVLYLERLRRGLGSPFRLIDQALRDTELERNRDLALAMLAWTLRGETYLIEPSALQPVALDGTAAGIARLHLDLIDSAVVSTREPRVGELSVRLAYRLAAASGTVSRQAPEIATSAAAQVRDRILAARDARELVEAAARTEADLFVLMREWRDARRLQVERPVIVPLSARAEHDAVERLPSLLEALEAISRGDGVVASASDSVAPDPDSVRLRDDVIGRRLAARLVAVARARDLPPQAPIVVTLTGYGPLIRTRTAPAAERRAREQFVSETRNEEELVAQYALLRSRLGRDLPPASVALLTAGAALRPYAQERAWLHGDAAPTARDLQVGFGVTVTYDSTVRPSWRPYLRRSLALALTDLKRVLTSYDPRGLQVHFGESPLRERALALHDPVKRTIYFPATTSAGVMAHEFAHDLDWLTGRRYYNGPGWYRTDRAVRQASDQLSGALRQMASASRSDSGRMTPQQRPTEVFARNVDWFVSAALALEGRLNGHLSAVQDPVLVGYGSASTPEAALEGGSATLRALSGMTSIPPHVRTWFSSRFGAERRTSVHEAVRVVLETPLRVGDLPSAPTLSLWAPDAIEWMMRSMPVTSAAWTCLLDPFIGRSGDVEATRMIVQLAAESRARGIVRRWSVLARRYPAAASPMLRGANEPPWDPAVAEDLTRQVRDAILWRALATRSSDAVTEALAASGALRAQPGCADPR